jgi:sugar phosphate isomerase/epimerase
MRKTSICLAMLIALCVLGVNSMAETAQSSNEIHCKCCTKPAPYDGWKIGVQAWSFNRFSFYESLDKSLSLGLRYIEAYPGQKLGGDNGKMRFDHNLPANLRKEVKEKLADVNIKIVNYGVVGLSAKEKDCRKVFDFAKDMGVETIISEPGPDALDLIDRLCQEYKIKVAIHNHPKSSR